jgi:hypothetical protein
MVVVVSKKKVFGDGRVNYVGRRNQRQRIPAVQHEKTMMGSSIFTDLGDAWGKRLRRSKIDCSDSGYIRNQCPGLLCHHTRTVSLCKRQTPSNRPIFEDVVRHQLTRRAQRQKQQRERICGGGFKIYRDADVPLPNQHC